MITRIIGLINMVCCILHVLLQAYLWGDTSDIISFVLIENILIAGVFLFFGFYHLKVKKKIFYIDVSHMLYWSIFLIFVLYLKPKFSTLIIVGQFIAGYQWVILALTSCAVLILSLINIVREKRSM